MKFSTALLMVLLLASCHKSEISNSIQDLNSIGYGTSFGECLGYCIHSIEMTESTLNYNKIGWDMNGTLPEQKRSVGINKTYWNNLIENIDFNSLLQMDSIIGCPDCADGGAEWIEIIRDGQRVKIVFEYRNEPEAISSLIQDLRTYMAAADIEDTNTVNFNNRTLIRQSGTIRNFVCSRGCYQYLIETKENNAIANYYCTNLDSDYQQEGVEIEFSGVLQNDSTTINKPAANDVPVPDFKARNIEITAISVNGID